MYDKYKIFNKYNSYLTPSKTSDTQGPKYVKSVTNTINNLYCFLDNQFYWNLYTLLYFNTFY